MIPADKTTKQEHTSRFVTAPTPWEVIDGVPDGGGIGIGPAIEGIGPHTIVTFNGGESEAIAAHIVRAVNAHDALVEALHTAWAALTPDLPEPLSPLARQITIATIKKALARAEGGE